MRFTIFLFFVCFQVVAAGPVTVIGHRGACSLAPENTLASFQKAIDLKTDCFEFDVWYSKDDSLMIIHDPTVDRTTNGTGSVNDLPYSQLRDLDAGRWFDTSFTGQKIPTLYETLALAKANNIIACIHVNDGNSTIIPAVIAMIKKVGVEDQVILFSFYYSQVKSYKQLTSKPALWLLPTTFTTSAVDSAVAISADRIGPAANSGITDSVIHYAHSKGLEVWGWTINDSLSRRKYIEFGMDGIITDYPQTLIRFVSTMNQSLKIVSQPDSLSWYTLPYQYQIVCAKPIIGDTLSYVLRKAPAWLHVDKNGNISGTVSSKGMFPIDLLVSDQHYNIASQTYSLTVKERKTLTLANSTIALGNMLYGDTKDTSIVLSNRGIDTVSIVSIASNNFLTFSTPETFIPPNQSIHASVQFSPPQVGEVHGEIVVISDADDSPDTIMVTASVSIPTSDKLLATTPHKFALYQNYPNPFNPSTIIYYQVPCTGLVTLKVYSILGKEVATLVDGIKFTGSYSAIFDSRKLSSGVYFYELKADNYILTKKMLLIK